MKQIAVKAQVRTGGRGGGVFENGFKGGVRFCANDKAELTHLVNNMLNRKIFTRQTGTDGELCSTVNLN